MGNTVGAYSVLGFVALNLLSLVADLRWRISMRSECLAYLCYVLNAQAFWPGTRMGPGNVCRVLAMTSCCSPECVWFWNNCRVRLPMAMVWQNQNQCWFVGKEYREFGKSGASGSGRPGFKSSLPDLTLGM